MTSTHIQLWLHSIVSGCVRAWERRSVGTATADRILFDLPHALPISSAINTAEIALQMTAIIFHRKRTLVDKI